MEDHLSPQERKSKRRGLMTSMVVHSIAIILLLLPFLQIPNPPPGQAGIQVNLGLPDVGQGEENAPPAAPVEPTPPTPTKPNPQPEEKPVKKPEPVKDKPVVKTEDPEAIALRRRQEQERQQQETQRRAEQEAAQKRAEEEARKKAEADKLKGDIGGLFGSGSGKGQTGKPGNQGDPEGDPNADKLKGVSTGSGTVGGGLGSRGVLAQPRITDNSQQEGTVVLAVCVDQDGNVVSADFTQRGSVNATSALISIARTNALKWKFDKGSVERQCGTITYRFRLQ